MPPTFPRDSPGQTRDTESNLDFFNARYLSSGLGRFTSADPANAGGDITNPQSWNGYGYVLGNPLALVGPSGLGGCTAQNHYCGQASSLPHGPYGSLGILNTDLSGYDLFGLLGLPSGTTTYEQGAASEFGGDALFYATGLYVEPVSTPPTTPLRQPPKTGSKQTFSQCMAAHANDSSLLGAADALTNVVFNRHDTYKNNVALGAVAGNSITSLLYGSTADAAGTGVTLAPTIVTEAMGTATSYGRRTTTIMALNIAGKGGVPLALGSSSAGAKAALNTAGELLGIGLDFEVKLAIDAASSAGEAGYRYIQTQ